MKIILILLFITFMTACSGGKNEVNQYELYGDKRVDCKTTKTTDEAANVIQCPNIRPDSEDISDTDDLHESYSPEKYDNIY